MIAKWVHFLLLGKYLRGSILNYLGNSNMNAVGDSKSVLPELKNDGRMHVSLSGNRFQQNKVLILNNDNVVNICVY